MWNEVTISWNEVTIFWNEVTIRWNEVTWNEVTMERSDRIPSIAGCVVTRRAYMYVTDTWSGFRILANDH